MPKVPVRLRVVARGAPSPFTAPNGSLVGGAGPCEPLQLIVRLPHPFLRLLELLLLRLEAVLELTDLALNTFIFFFNPLLRLGPFEQCGPREAELLLVFASNAKHSRLWAFPLFAQCL